MLVYIFFYYWVLATFGDKAYTVLVNLEMETQQSSDVTAEHISVPCFFSSNNIPRKINQSATFAVSNQSWKEIIC